MVANFVLMGYGTGAIFGCPAHDQRDLDFARKYGLSVTPVVVPSDAGNAGVAPYEVIDNPLCPLDVADIVFIDPPGTGYSRMVGAAKAEDGWGLEQDAEIVAGFIRAWLTAHRRWASPRYMCGESYGTTRAVAVAGKTFTSKPWLISLRKMLCFAPKSKAATVKRLAGVLGRPRVVPTGT